MLTMTGRRMARSVLELGERFRSDDGGEGSLNSKKDVTRRWMRRLVALGGGRFGSSVCISVMEESGTSQTGRSDWWSDDTRRLCFSAQNLQLSES